MPNKIDHRIIDSIECKLCSNCKNWISMTGFYRNKRIWDGLNIECKQCSKITNRDYYFRNKATIIEQARLYYYNNKEYVNSRNKSYYERNKILINAYKSKWQKQNRINRNKRLNDRYLNDVNYRIAVNLRVRVLKAVGNNQRSGSTLDILGCSVNDFKDHISSKFYSDMSWKNHGILWHIDHIKPCSSFDLSDGDQQRSCFHYTNMQPLLISDNLSKGSRVL